MRNRHHRQHRHHHRHIERLLRMKLSPLGYIRFKLHRRIFVMIGASIACTVVTAAVISHLLGGGTMWHKETERLQGFVGQEYGRVWDQPVERQALLERMAQGLELRLALVDPAGQTVARVGAPCPRAMMSAPVLRDGVRLGTLEGCADRYAPAPWRWLLPMFLAAMMLWGIAGKLARRITRPLSMVIQVAEDLGAGKLDSRAELSCYHHGEERVLAESINRMADRIQRQMADQRELLAAVSHELRTPLGHLRLLIEMARDCGATEKTFDELDKEVTEIDRLVGDLLANSRLNFTALSLRPLSGCDLAARALERAGMPATLLQAEGKGELEGDATLLSRALANLLENARAHGGGVEALKVTRQGEQVRFEVLDRGPGFAPGDEKRAFEAFYHRPHGAAGEGEAGSLGLGLALVRRIAEAHGGTAEAGNREGGGARVAFTVKALAQPTPERAPAPAGQPVPA